MTEYSYVRMPPDQVDNNTELMNSMAKQGWRVIAVTAVYANPHIEDLVSKIVATFKVGPYTYITFGREKM